MINDQSNPCCWADDEPDDEPRRHGCWQVFFADGTWQRIGAWPPMSRDEVLAAYRCLDAVSIQRLPE